MSFDAKAHTSRAQQQKSNGAAERLPLVMFGDCQLDTEVFWTIDDVLPRCSMMMVYGRGGCGKTYLLSSVAIGIASGRWFTYEAEKGAVLYCAFERPQDAIDRMAALRAKFSFGDLPIAVVALGGRRLDDELAELIVAAGKELAARTKATLKAIVVDTSAAALGGRREDDQGFGQLRMIGEHVHAETGALVIWSHHEGKGEGMGPRGHTTLADACAVLWEVVEREDGSRTVFVAKANRGPCHSNLFAFRLAPFVADRDRRGRDIELCAVELVDLETALASKVRQRYGGQQQANPDAGLGSRQRLLLRLLHKLLPKYADGVPRDTVRSHFISELHAERERKGEPALPADQYATAFRKTLSRLSSRIDEDGELLRPAA